MAPGPSLLALSSLPSRVCSSRAGRRAPASRHSPLTLLAAAFWRLPFGGDVPQPTSVERRPADHPRLGARTAKATPPLWRAHAETPPRCKPRPFPRRERGRVSEFRNPRAVARRGLCSVQPVGRGAGQSGLLFLPHARGRKGVLPAKEAACFSSLFQLLSQLRRESRGQLCWRH